MFDLAPISKAIAGGIIAALVALAAKYGFSITPAYTDTLGVLLTGGVAYIVGHLFVYFAPANRK